MDIAIVGAGVVGASCALFLQRDGHRVVMVDPLPPGAGTSSGNAGIIATGLVTPVATWGTLKALPSLLADPESPLAVRWRYLPRLVPWLVRAALACRPGRAETLSDAIVALTSRADLAHDLVIQQAGLGELVRSVGFLEVARSEGALLRATAFERAMLDRAGIAYAMLDADEVREREPALARDLGPGLLIPGNRSIRHPQRYVEGIARTVIERGGRWLRARAERPLLEGGRMLGLVTDQGEVRADAVVLAAGAFSRRLAALAGVRAPLDAERGYHVMLPHPERTLRAPVLSAEGGFVLAPMEHGIRLTGGVELASPEAPPDFARVRRLVRQAARLVPGLDPRVLSEWQGCRPSLPDSLPVIGRAPRFPNLYLAFGHQHIGLTLGPLTGRIVADMVGGRDPGVDLAPYRPDRRFF